MFLKTLLLTSFVLTCYGSPAFLTTIKNNSSKTICSEFNQKFKSLPNNSQETDMFFVTDKYPDYGCNNHSVNYKQNLVFVKRGNCSFALKARNVQNNNGSGIIIVSDVMITPGADDEDYLDVNIYVAIVTVKSYNRIKDFSQSLNISVIKMKLLQAKSDYSLVLLQLIAVLTCLTGAWWKSCSFNSFIKQRSGVNNVLTIPDGQLLSKKKPAYSQLLIYFILIFVASTSILLVYYFYNFMVYVFIVLFCFVSFLSTFYIMNRVFSQFSWYKSERFIITIDQIRNQTSIFQILLFQLILVLIITWFILRKSTFSWVLQDIFGVFICLFGIIKANFQNYKQLSLILLFYFLYDIFYVFITPFLTSNGESIMMNIATSSGGKSNEELPLLFKMPKFISSTCSMSMSLLGFGDVGIPGVHVALCASWDILISEVKSKKTRVYFITSGVAYFAGLMLTAVALYFMQSGQPALLYIVPCLWSTTSVVALLRGEFCSLMRGEMTAADMLPRTDELLVADGNVAFVADGNVGFVADGNVAFVADGNVA